MKTKTRGCLWIPAAAALLQLFAQAARRTGSRLPRPLLFAITGHRETVRFGALFACRTAATSSRWRIGRRSSGMAMTGEEVVRLIDGERVYTSSPSPTGARVYVETLAYSPHRGRRDGRNRVRVRPERAQPAAQGRSGLLRATVSPRKNAAPCMSGMHRAESCCAASKDFLLPLTLTASVGRPMPRALAVIQSDGALKVWRVEDGEELAAFQANEPVPGSGSGHMQWSADGQPSRYGRQ